MQPGSQAAWQLGSPAAGQLGSWAARQQGQGVQCTVLPLLSEAHRARASSWGRLRFSSAPCCVPLRWGVRAHAALHWRRLALVLGHTSQLRTM